MYRTWVQSTARMVLEGSNQQKMCNFVFPKSGKIILYTWHCHFKFSNTSFHLMFFFCLFVLFLHILQVENKNTYLHFYRHIHTTKIDYVETRYTRHKVYTVHVHRAHCKKTKQNKNNRQTKRTIIQRHFYKTKIKIIPWFANMSTPRHSVPLIIWYSMDERSRTQVLSITVSQCQTSMRDVNPTSQQGPEEEPLKQSHFEPAPTPRHQANTALYHTHTDMPTVGRTPTDWTHLRRRHGTDNWQEYGRRWWRDCISLMAEGWNRAILIKVSWERHPLSWSDLRTTVSYWRDATE